MPKRLFKIHLYLLGHFLVQAIHQPKKFFKNLRKAKINLLQHGLKKSWKLLLCKYLPENYLLKTKLHIKEPSFSIYSKLVDWFTPQEIITSSTIGPNQLSEKQKILIIRSGALGDVLLATPIIKKIFDDRKGFCEITIATKFPEIFRNNPYIDNVIHPKKLNQLNTNFGLILNLDMAYEKNKRTHISEVYAHYAFGSTKSKINLQPQLFSTREDKITVNQFIKNINSPYIVSHNRYDPTQPYRNIPKEDWKNLLKKLFNNDLAIIQIGSPDMDIALDINEKFIDARGVFNLQQTKELIVNAKLFIGTDAGPLHIAASTDTPIVSFFTIAHHETRKPMRAHIPNLFRPITPNISCYGCTNTFLLPWGWKCQRGDSACTKLFDMNTAFNTCKTFL